MTDAIILSGVKTHNLKNLDLTLPHKKLYVVTGVSGSGKSSLAFDTLYAEGQRRYVESLSSYARQFLERIEKPDIESASGIPPALAIEAKNTVNNARSTVGTQTEINDYLRVLYARVGKVVCPDCREEAVASSPQSIAQFLIEKFTDKKVQILFRIELTARSEKYLEEALGELERQGFSDVWLDGNVYSLDQIRAEKLDGKSEFFVCADSMKVKEAARKRLVDSVELASRSGRGVVYAAHESKLFRFSDQLSCVRCGRIFREPVPNLFSFNSPLGACETCQGFGRVITIDWRLVIPDEHKTLKQGAVEPWTKPSAAPERRQLMKFCERRRIPVDKPWEKLTKTQQKQILFGDGKDKDYFSVQDFFDYLQKKTYKMHVRIFLAKYRGFEDCPQCHASRLKKDALNVLIEGRHIAEVMDMNLDDLYRFISDLHLTPEQKERSEAVHAEILNRVRFLNEVGLGYLTLSRLSRTLSGGEVQRIHLASSLGAALVGTLYVLDEPSIGLHERDNAMLIRLLKELRDLGNTVVVVEHDRSMIEAADEVLDMGPLGGEQGGRILYQGPVQKISLAKESLTGKYLSNELLVGRQSTPGAVKVKDFIRIREAGYHNLKNISVDIPLGRMVVLTGVSGSGKSTLIYETLYNQFLKYKGRPVSELGSVKSIEGFELVDEVVLIDQSPIGRTPRSNPVTYLKAFDDIRKCFAATPQSKREGFSAGHFSFNVDGGRCPVCKGDGSIKVEMHFLADVFVTCEACRGKRFKQEILEVRYLGKNIDEVLELTIDEAAVFFDGNTKLVKKLELLQRVGLGYLRLGQSATTLSGGEAQRLKLAVEMLERYARHILYLFDEPTSGLHFHDIHYLMSAFENLLARGHSLLIIEHNMDIIRLADHVIDLGPEGGHHGGEVLFSGSVSDLMKCSKSHTGKHLKEYLAKLAPANESSGLPAR